MTAMKLTLSLALLSAVILSSAQGADTARTLKGVEDRYNKAQTLEVSFTQTYKQRNRNITEKGTLFLRKPQRMLWRYSSPEGRVYVMDGNYTYDYTPGEKQVERVPFKKTDDMRAPLAFLLGKLNFHDDFRDEVTTAADGTITLLAKSDKYLYSEVSFQSDPDFAIRKLVVKLQDNSVIEYRFDGEKRNPTLSDELFKFTPPAGVQIVQANR